MNTEGPTTNTQCLIIQYSPNSEWPGVECLTALILDGFIAPDLRMGASSKWIITPIMTELTLLPLLNGVITDFLTGLNQHLETTYKVMVWKRPLPLPFNIQYIPYLVGLPEFLCLSRSTFIVLATSRVVSYTFKMSVSCIHMIHMT